MDHLQIDQADYFEVRPEAEASQDSSLTTMAPIDLSGKARLQKASRLIAQILEGRARKVRAIAKAIRNNSYQVDSFKVADAIIAHAILKC
ncbi:MAG: flagellar biosynthesis anti-sigma factor FlgM [Desulfobacteraceae bacterium]